MWVFQNSWTGKGLYFPNQTSGGFSSNATMDFLRHNEDRKWLGKAMFFGEGISGSVVSWQASCMDHNRQGDCQTYNALQFPWNLGHLSGGDSFKLLGGCSPRTLKLSCLPERGGVAGMPVCAGNTPPHTPPGQPISGCSGASHACPWRIYMGKRDILCSSFFSRFLLSLKVPYMS